MPPSNEVVNTDTNDSYRSHRSYRIYFGNEGFTVSNSSSNPTTTYNPTVFLPLSNKKPSCALNCRSCQTLVAKNVIPAVLLNNTRTEIFATDIPPFGAEGVGPDCGTKSCNCRVTDLACLSCGNTIGYTLSYICSSCTSEHQWRFHKEAVTLNDVSYFNIHNPESSLNFGLTKPMMTMNEFPGR
ncbi:hypothetical protein K7432_004412 [Basidiobolus ranarum]|uniref:Uncharacterized protein n=1 Tax=Basidiobolus ranarum TaxID=34480 RepID=A0ABR2W5K4_9FUNG